MNFRRWGPALLLLGWLQLAAADEPPRAPRPPDAQAVQDKQPDKAKPRAGAEPMQIPYRLTNTQHILVRVKIDGKGPFNFIVDTGAPIMILATEPAKKMGVQPGKDGFTKFDRVEIEGGAVLEKFPCLIETPFQLEGMNAMGLPGRELHGILGYTVLAKFRMEIDFTRDKMVWTPLAYEPPPPKAPKGAGKGGQGGLEVIGMLSKVLAMFIEKAPPPVARGFIGIELKDEKDRVSIAAVLGKSPAETAGLKAGDEIVEINSKKVQSASEVHRLTADAAVGRPIVIVVRRGGEKHNIRLTPGDGL